MLNQYNLILFCVKLKVILYLKKRTEKGLGLFELSFKRNGNEFNSKHEGIKVETGFIFISLKSFYLKI